MVDVVGEWVDYCDGEQTNALLHSEFRSDKVDNLHLELILLIVGVPVYMRYLRCLRSIVPSIKLWYGLPATWGGIYLR